jgi:prophage regulatory protein
MTRPEVTGRKTDRRLLDYKALRERGIPWTRIHLARLEAAGKFPLHINVGESSIAWFADEIDDFLEAKALERDAKAAALAAKADSSTTDSDCDRPQGVVRKRRKSDATASASASVRPEHT